MWKIIVLLKKLRQFLKGDPKENQTGEAASKEVKRNYGTCFNFIFIICLKLFLQWVAIFAILTDSQNI